MAYDILFDVGLSPKSVSSLKDKIRKLCSTNYVDLKLDVKGVDALKNKLSKGFDTTVRFHADMSELQRAISQYGISNINKPLTSENFISQQTLAEGEKSLAKYKSLINDFKKSEATLRKKARVVADGEEFDRSMLTITKDTTTQMKAAVAQIYDAGEAYQNQFNALKATILSLENDPRFSKALSQLPKRFRSFNNLLESVNKTGENDKTINIGNIYGLDTGTDEIDALMNKYGKLRQQLRDFSDANNISRTNMRKGVNQVLGLDLDKLAEAGSIIQQMENINKKLQTLKGDGWRKLTLGTTTTENTVLDQYMKALEMKLTRTQEIAGVLNMATEEASTANRAAVTTSVTTEAAINVQEQLANGLNNIPINSFVVNPEAITAVKNSIQEQLNTLRIGQTITFTPTENVGEGQRLEERIVLPNVLIEGFEITASAQEKLKNDVQAILKNVTLEPTADNSEVIEGIDKLTRTYQNKLNTIARNVNKALTAPVIEEIDATAAIEKMKQQINDALRSFQFDINGRVAHGTITTGADENGAPLYKTYEDMETKLATITKATKSNVSKLVKLGNFDGAQDLINQYNTYIEKIKEFKTQLREVDAEGNVAIPLEEANKSMTELVRQSHILQDSFNNIDSKASINKTIDKMVVSANKSVEEIGKYIQNDETRSLTSAYSADNTGLIAKLKAFQTSLPTLSLEEANTQMAALIGEADTLEQRMETLGVNTPLTATLERDLSAADALERKILNLQTQMQKSLVTNSKGFKISQYRERFNQIYNQLSSNSLTTEDFKALSTQWKKLTKDMTEAGATGKSVGTILKGMFAKFGSWSMVTMTIQRVVMVFRRMVSAVQEVDTALTNLRKVTKATESDITRFMDGVGDAAYKMGASVSDLINATAEFSRLGYDLTQAQKLGELATMYKTVAEDLDITTASQSIVSTLKAFEKAGVSAERIVDVFNYIGNNFAISSAGIGEAMQRSAASLQTANNSLEQSVALITAANEVAQDPIKVGTAMKTLSARIRGSKTELTELGEDIDFLAEGTSKLRDEILSLSGVDIMVDDTTFKSTYQIIDELSTAYQGMVETSQARLAEMLGGKNQANIISALLENFDTARKAYAEATSEADGSAQKELATALDSINGKVSQLTATWQTFATDVLESDVFKGIIDGANMFLKILDKLIGDSNMLIKLVPMIFAGVGIAKNKTGLGEPKNQKVLYICPEFASHINNRLYAA